MLYGETPAMAGVKTFGVNRVLKIFFYKVCFYLKIT